MRYRLNFNLLRSQLLCIHGSRCAKQIFKDEDEDVNLVVSKSQIWWYDGMILQPQSQVQKRENCN